MDEIGSDGLTDAERVEYAREWETGLGSIPSREASVRAYFELSNELANAIREAGGDPDEPAPLCSCGRYLCRKARLGEKGHHDARLGG